MKKREKKSPEHEHEHQSDRVLVTNEERALEVKEGLEAIYGGSDDLQTVTKSGAKTTRVLVRVVLALAALVLVAFGGYFVYANFIAPQNTQKPLSLSFDAPTEVQSGADVTFVLHYGNPTRLPLASLALDLNLPSAFILHTSEPSPTNADEMSYDIGSLPAGSDGTITVTGVWLADVPSTTTIQMLATYRPGNFNADFHDIATATIVTNASNLTLDFTGAANATPGSDSAYTLHVTNSGVETFASASLKVTLPDGFLLAKSTPALTPGGESMWELGDIAAAGSADVTFSGTFSANATDVKQFIATLGVKDGDRKLTQDEKTVFTDVAGSDVRLELVANGSTGRVALDPGSVLRVSLRISNSGGSTLSGVSALLDFTADGGLPLAFSSGSYDGGTVTKDGVRFGESVVGTLAPGDRKLLNIVIPVKPALLDTDATSFSFSAEATQGGTSVQSTPMTVNLNADTSIAASARYYDDAGAPVGDGPLPPVVGEGTSYRVIWTLGNGLHALEKITVSATLPGNVSWGDFSSTDTGTLAYDSGTHTVRWTIVSLAADVQTVSANFRVTVVPTNDDADKFVKLLSGTSVSATDSQTEAAISRSVDAITSELVGDTFAAGKGVVIR